MEAFEWIYYSHSGLMTPMFIFFCFGLSEILLPLPALYLYVVVSNLWVPVRLFGAYQFLSFAIAGDRFWDDMGWLAFYLFETWLSSVYLISWGADAYYWFLGDDLPSHADTYFYPTIIYPLGWWEHDDRY